MERRAFLVWMALPGCGLVSGLDTLHVGDASSPVDASDAAAADVTSSDASTTSDVATDAPGIACGPERCAVGTFCCVTQANGSSKYTYSCGTKDACSSASNVAILQCDDKTDCAGSLVPVCCFLDAKATCIASNGSGCSLLCTSDGQCATGQKCTSFDAGFGLALERCQ